MKALNGKPKIYWEFYNMLRSPSQDYRLRVFRQVCKRDVLNGLKKEEIPALAAMLEKKPLYDWREKDFGHINNLRASDVARLLIHMEELKHLVPTMHNQADLSIAFRSLDVAAQFDSIEALKENLTQTDANWLMLAKKMQLTKEF